MKLFARIASWFPRPRLFKRIRLVRHVRMVVRIRDFNSSPAVKTACTALLHALVTPEEK